MWLPQAKRWRVLAARYDVPVRALAAANGLLPGSDLRVGFRLVVPVAASQPGTIHIVRRGELLSLIAARYGVTIDEIVTANSLTDPNYVFTGQRLFIPMQPRPAMPTPPPINFAAPAAATAVGQPPTAACPGGCAALSIISPTVGLTVTSPLLISGIGSSAEGSLVVRVLNASGFEVGVGSAAIDAPAGASGLYSGTVAYGAPLKSEPGRVQVYSIDPRDGAMEALTSVVVMLAGAGQDAAIETLKDALESKDYDALLALLPERWNLGFYRSEGMTLTSEAALRQLQQNFLGPGDVTVDLSVDARKLLGGQVAFSPEVTYVIFSTGWGPDGADDALLLFDTDDEGVTHWAGMLVIYEGLREYERP